ncbi:sensor histidine kinase [Polyangium sorediatum]|uniref:histidine kinase n=1 Tax=Polyangium sorediatum TaxID=889274 RepID=A0ABT6NTA8_9BACT|nr:HAMP domain-containing sensor histidine kinase [Polyangium sorediatum]MDI1431387.1 HAMP domain-containing sensor histidine kinase [Polyangium sorediatum]
MNLARKRLTRKLLAVFATPVILGFVVTGVVSIRTTRASLVESSERALADNIATLRTASLPIAATGRTEEAVALVERVAAEETVHGVAFYDERGAPFVRSSALRSAPSALDVLAARAVATGDASHGTLQIGDEEVLVRVEPVRDAPGLGAVVMTRELGPIDRMIDLTLVRLALTGGAAALCVSLVAIWISRVLGRAWGDLVHAVDRVAAGDLDVRVEASPELELDRVAGAVNDMTRSLAEAREKLLAAEAERTELAARMRHAQALAVVGQVAGSFAHEIGSPLNTILGWSRLSAADDDLPEPVRRQFETIAGQCERITRIVQRMLDVSRPPTDHVVPVQLADVVRDVSAFLAPDLRVRRIELRLVVAERLPPIVAVRDRLLQVVMNLCINAIQAQPRGGTLRISLARGEEAGPEREPVLRLEVADAGPGIPEEKRSQVFELFYSTKVESGGTGLGLPIVADVVRDLGGRVEIGDAPEGGALFRVLLPAGSSSR